MTTPDTTDHFLHLLHLHRDNEALRRRAEAAEALLKHERASTEAGARLCNEAFAVLTTKVHTLEARLAKAEKAHDAVLRELEAERKDCEELRKEVGVLVDWRDTLAEQRVDAINRRDAALRQSTAQLRRVEALEAELAEALAQSRAQAKERDDALRQVQELRATQPSPPSVRVTVYITEEDDGLPD